MALKKKSYTELGIMPVKETGGTGAYYYVSSVTGSNNNPGTKELPFATIDYAQGRCSSGDVVFALPGHTETISAAGTLAMDTAGVTVVFLGEGSSRATLNFTATASDVDITAANVTFVNPRFLTGIDAVVAALHVAAADFKMKGAEFYDAAAMAATIQVLTTSAANRMVIDGYKYFASTTGTQKTDGIKLVGGSGIVLKNIDITGDFTNSPINVSTTTLLNQWENIYVNNTSSSPAPAMTIGANATGFAKNVKCRIASGSTYVSSVAKIQWAADCEGFVTDGYGGKPLGTALSTGIEGKIDVIDGYFDVPTADATTNVTIRDVVGIKTDASVYVPGTTKTIAAYVKGHADMQERVAKKAAAVMVNGDTIFTVAGGPILVMGLFSLCVAPNDGTASTVQYSATPTVGSATTISAASGSIANAAAGATVSLAGTALSTAALYAANGPNLIANPGTIVIPAGTIKVVIGVGSTTGTWEHYIRYKPMAAGVTVS